jgi:hypothetical protein
MTEDTKPGPGDQPLVGASEAALLLGVELSTFSHLRRREAHEEGSKFPKPVATLRCGPIWKTSEIKRFATKYEKPRPGPKPGAVTPLPTKRTRARKISAAAVAGNGKANGETKRVAKKTVAKKVPATVKRVVKKVPTPVA